MNFIDPLEEETQETPSVSQPILAPAPSVKHEPTHLGSVVQLIASLLLLLGSWFLAGMLAFGGFLQATTATSAGLLEATSSTLLATAMFIVGCVGLANAFFSAYRLLGKKIENYPPTFFKIVAHPVVLVLMLLLSLIFGFAVSQEETLRWWALPPAHLISSVSAILLLLWFAVREVDSGSPQRSWGAFVSGLVLAPMFAIVVELLMIVVIVIVIALYLSMNPEHAILIERLQLYLSVTAEPIPEELLEIIMPLMSDGFIISMLILTAGLFVPLIEELIKPIGVWLLAGKKDLTPAQGFALGALSGAGYALFENLTIISANEEWAFVAAMRSGTTVVHILATGVIGWALVCAWQEKRYLRLAGVYAASVTLHGVWNSLVVLNAINSVIEPSMASEIDIFWIAPYWVTTGTISYFMLILGAFGTLFWLNKVFQKQTVVLAERPRLIENQTEE